MSDDADWEALLRAFERQQGKPLTAEEREQLEKLRPELQQDIAKAVAHAKVLAQAEARHAEHEVSPLLAFMRKLMQRQGTAMPDFDDLYRKKADLDRRLLDP